MLFPLAGRQVCCRIASDRWRRQSGGPGLAQAVMGQNNVIEMRPRISKKS